MASHSLELHATPASLNGRWALSPTPAHPGLTRRHLLKIGASVAALASFGGATRWLSILGPSPDAALRRSTWEGLIGSQVTVWGAHTVNVRLTAVADLAGARPADRERAFSLLFHGGSSDRLAQGVYRLAHPAVGTQRMLLAPAGTGRHGQDYAVVVNRVTYANS